jgi:hypothetical protein
MVENIGKILVINNWHDFEGIKQPFFFSFLYVKLEKHSWMKCVYYLYYMKQFVIPFLNPQTVNLCMNWENNKMFNISNWVQRV